MAKETVLYSGVFTETCDTRGKKTIDSVVRKVLLENGYPVVGNTCNQPNICDLLTDCGFSTGIICSLNGLTGDGTEGNCIQIGGDLIQDTVVNTDTFDFSITKDAVSLDINDNGTPLGAGGETARFIGTSAGLTAEIGVYTPAGAPAIGMRSYNTGTDFYSQMVHSPSLESLIIETGEVSAAYNAQITMVSDGVVMGLTGSSDTNITVKKATFTGGTDVIQLINLPTFGDNADAVGEGLPVNSLYKITDGARTLIAIVV